MWESELDLILVDPVPLGRLKMLARTSVRSRTNPAKDNSVWLEQALLLEPELRKYAWPPRTLEAERNSLAYHSTLMAEVREVDWQKVMPQAVAAYAPARYDIPDAFTSGGLNYTRELHDRIVSTLNRQANPGAPYSRLATTKGVLAEVYGDWLFQLTLHRLSKIGAINYADMTPLQLVQNGLCDPVRVFIKNEPHKVTKLQEGRARLISNVSVVDEIIDRLLSLHQIDKEIAEYEKIPSKAGLGFTDSMSRSLYESVNQLPFETASSDVSAWDWRFQPWMFDACVELDIALCDNPTPLWEHMMRFRAYALARKLFLDSQGCAYALDGPGIQASGSFRTTAWNCKARVLSAYLVGARWAMAMGDDAAEECVPDVEHRYSQLGVVLTDYVTAREMQDKTGASFEFCSHLYYPDRAVPLNWVKRLFNLLQNAPDDVLLEQWAMESRHDPMFTQCLSLINRVWKGLENQDEQE